MVPLTLDPDLAAAPDVDWRHKPIKGAADDGGKD